jgi:hypothetical protein
VLIIKKNGNPNNAKASGSKPNTAKAICGRKQTKD